MSAALKFLLVALLAVGGSSLTAVARADVTCPECTNAENGDNESDTGQGGESASGDAVAGQVTGVVSSGQTSVDATNHSEDVDVSSGDTDASNTATNFTGQNAEDTEILLEVAGTVTGIIGVNAQDGDNSSDLAQAAEASSGDGVGGQVIGVVTSAGGSADVVAANTSEDVDVATGDGSAANGAETIAVQSTFGSSLGTTFIGDLSGTIAANVLDGDNEAALDQDAGAATGDGVGGQVIGIVSAGDTSVDATNASDDVDIETGDADAINAGIAAAGQGAQADMSTVITGDLSGAIGANVQDGDNTADAFQNASAATGDGVGGQVIGVVTSATGEADVVAANTSEDVDVSTGDATVANDTSAIAIQTASDGSVVSTITGDVSGEIGINVLEGDNSADSSQDASAASGDGVGGQVIGVVSAGETSVDATNASEDVDIETGDADTENVSEAVAAQTAIASAVVTQLTGDLSGTIGVNVQDGDNSAEASQAAEAASGDGVGGQVIGVVTSAGGSADVVAANDSDEIDIETGDGGAANEASAGAGQSATDTNVISDITGDVSGTLAINLQDGDNETELVQSATSVTGDGVGGQVIGVVSAGDTSVDATNASEDVDLETGDADALNTAVTRSVQFVDDASILASPPDGISLLAAINIQEGDNSTDGSQAADAASGDGVGGQVIGTVTSAGGEADVVAANTSEDVDISTGDGDATNSLAALAVQNIGELSVGPADIDALVAVNVQDGDNEIDADQVATASTGDGVGGQVIGIVSAGDTSVDATNLSEDVDLTTGDANASSVFAGFAGQTVGDVVFEAEGADVEVLAALNAQDGDNEKELVQEAVASSGDGVGGQVVGVVTSAGGSADLVLANTSEDIDGESGDSDFFNTDEEFVGQHTTIDI